MIRPNQQKCKILVLTDTFVGFPGGSERHLFNLLTGISPQFEVKAFQLLAHRDFEFTQGIGSKRDNVDLFDRPIQKIISLATLKLILELWLLCKKDSIDIIASYHEKSDLIAYILSYLPGLNVKVISSKRDMGFKLSSRLKSIMKFIMPRFDLVVAPSKAIADLARDSYGSKKAVVVHNGVDLDRFKPNPDKRLELRQKLSFDKEEFVFVCTAQFKPIKGHEVLIKAFADAYEKSNRSLRLILLGDGELEDDLRKLCQELNIGDVVYFAGVTEQVEDWLLLSDASITATYSEGLSNALVESASSGLPIIATNVGGNPEIVEEGYNGKLVEPKSVKQLSSAIQILIAKSNDCVEFSKNSRLLAVSKFSISSMVENMERTYLDVADLKNDQMEKIGVTKHG